MICKNEIRIASHIDAVCIAEMSKNFVESGLGWSWTPSRVIKEIKSKNSNVIVSLDEKKVTGFAVMEYFYNEARLNFFGVHIKFRR
jgi:hypothetical protein